MFKIVDNFLPRTFSNRLYTDVTEGVVPFYYRHLNVDYSKVSQLTHTCYHNIDKIKSEYFPVVQPIFYLIEKELDIEIVEVEKIKFNLMLNKYLLKSDLDTAIHQDIDDKNYITFLYYINDSDGDTCFYESNTLVNSVTPVKNRAVFFDSNKYHRATPPIKYDARFILNITFKI